MKVNVKVPAASDSIILGDCLITQLLGVETKVALASRFPGTMSTTPTNGSIIIKDISLVCTIVQLDPQVNAELLAAHDGAYCIENRAIGHFGSTISAGGSSRIINLGLGYSSLLAITAIMTPQTDVDGTTLNTYKNQPKFMQVKNNLTKYTLLVDGAALESLRGVEVKEEHSNEAIAMTLIGQGKLSDILSVPRFGGAAGAKNAWSTNAASSVDSNGVTASAGGGWFQLFLDLCTCARRRRTRPSPPCADVSTG